MNDDELKKLWQQQPLGDPPLGAQLMTAMQKQTSQLRRSLLWRDVRELAACVIVGVIFGIYYFTVHAPVARLGALITVAGAIFIAWKTLHARRATPTAKPDATVVESLRAELHSVRTQSQLLRSVAWWYLLPLAIGVIIFVWGMPITNLVFYFVFNISFTLFSLWLDVKIYRLNQCAVSEQLLPIERQLESLLRSAETGEPVDETHVASLRPIVLSMEAADKVKPVEFKVDFWQLALYGVPGIVGIWFFLMVGLTVGSGGWKTKEPAVETFPPAVRAEETNRYSVVAQKLVDLLNTGDYAAVQKLYDANMTTVFPPKETADFYTRLARGFGKIDNIEGLTGKGFRGWTAFRLHCQRGELTMSLALDADDKIAGIYFKPVPLTYSEWPVPPIEWLVPRIFSWRHLVWLPAFFLAGLLYSWLLQKTTERAVGISALGIHLHKGQNLILWDEIKEVRPFKLLNIRSLWLIRESGEKTLMRWTGLERHSDLKTAVESFAPADHPIRKHLSLLRRN
ncbi:MAG TPA: hypothetical protein VL171_03450 [Verrucomicrobiae bacterium]|nr:hypothetical protein [Verrucomicrobiae bacterium]